MSLDEHSRPSQIMFTNGSCNGPVLAPSNLFDSLVLVFCFARLCSVQQCVIYGVLRASFVDDWLVQLVRVSLSMMEIELSAGCWCPCQMFPTWPGVAVDGSLECYCYLCCRLMILLTERTWSTVVNSVCRTTLSILCRCRCWYFLLLQLPNSELLWSLLVFGGWFSCSAYDFHWLWSLGKLRGTAFWCFLCSSSCLPYF